MTSALVAGEQRRRDLASTAKRLRVAVMTDPSRSAELADTLVELVGNRLLAWSFVEAAADAPESVVLSARILAERGPIGPYAGIDDAVRYVTASAQLAAVQTGLGQPEAAGRTLDALEGWQRQLGSLPLTDQLPPVTIAWFLATRARATTDVAHANAYADAALQRLYAGLDLDPDLGYLAVSVLLAAADARWAAGRNDLALADHRLALDHYRIAVAGLQGTIRPAVVQAALAPLPELFGGFALRLEAAGEPVTGLAVRREWLALTQRLEVPAGAAAELAQVSLAAALHRAGRELEAEALLPGQVPSADPLPALAERRDWARLPAEQALGTDRLSVTASVRLRQDEQAALAYVAADRAVAEESEARLEELADREAARLAAARAEAERQAAVQAEAAEREATEQARLEAEAEAARTAALAQAERVVAEERRRERAAAHEAAHAVAPQAVRDAEVALPGARQAVAEADSETADCGARERLADLLRPLAVAEPARYRDELLTTLEALVSLRWRLGDAEGSREVARELKAW